MDFCKTTFLPPKSTNKKRAHLVFKGTTSDSKRRYGSHQVEEAADHLPLLQVGLPVQRGRLDVTQAVRVAGAQQQDVSGQNLVTSQPDEVSHPHLLPELLHVASVRPSTTPRGQTAG